MRFFTLFFCFTSSTNRTNWIKSRTVNYNNKFKKKSSFFNSSIDFNLFAFNFNFSFLFFFFLVCVRNRKYIQRKYWHERMKYERTHVTGVFNKVLSSEMSERVNEFSMWIKLNEIISVVHLRITLASTN